MSVKIIAYYLPQYHPFPENDEWWGKGFTEWTNVGKARALFRGHYQPKVPTELGYYDLRLPQVADEQAKLAKEAGVYGFCYWHYWFGKDKELMEMPFYRMVDSGKPDFPFCLGWANESWMSKQWSKNGVTGKLLIEQKYEGIDDYDHHFYKLLKAFKDKRYIRIDDKPFFLIYRPLEFEDLSLFMERWNILAKKESLSDGFYFVAHARNEKECDQLRKMKFDAINIGPTTRFSQLSQGLNLLRLKNKIHRLLTGCPNLLDYRYVIANLWNEKYEGKDDVLPTLIPNWDHSPRGGSNSLVFENCTIENWANHATSIIRKTREKDNKIIMLKSWNEWGEGNYMEPDIKNGRGYIETLSKILKSFD